MRRLSFDAVFILLVSFACQDVFAPTLVATLDESPDPAVLKDKPGTYAASSFVDSPGSLAKSSLPDTYSTQNRGRAGKTEDSLKNPNISSRPRSPSKAGMPRHKPTWSSSVDTAVDDVDGDVGYVKDVEGIENVPMLGFTHQPGNILYFGSLNPTTL